MRVRYIGCSEEQITYGGHDDPRHLLRVGEVYEVESWEVYAWQTKVALLGVPGRFNSVCFEDVQVRE